MKEGDFVCGICGFITKSPIKLDNLLEMNNAMRHRGPDDHGEEIYPYHECVIGFAHRRLSIIDLSDLGHQPMHSVDNRITVIFNGEIYNYLELKKQLTEYKFCSESDTEVIIAAYRKWGKECFQHFNGMFAIAIFDKESDEIILARDRIGKKPLYYYQYENQFVFASELKPIMLYPYFNRKINRSVLARYIGQQYITSPDSIFENVFKIQPGSYLVYKENEIVIEQYWSASQEYDIQTRSNRITDFVEAKRELKRAIEQAVLLRLRADVPVGTFLSGGIDSSLITAVAQSLSDQPIKTFSVGFREAHDEAVFAKKIASYLGAEHTEMYIEPDDLLKFVEDISEYYDEPFADSSEIPTMFLAKFASDSVKVVLSGDGGDEFFLGYPGYALADLAQKLDPIGSILHAFCCFPGLNKFSIEDKLPFKVKMISQNRNMRAKTQFPANYYFKIASDMINPDIAQKTVFYEIEDLYGYRKWIINSMLMTIDTYLPEDILCKVDRATMRYALEARCPLCDINVIRTAFRIPERYKIRRRNNKHILKELAYEYIPRELLDRPKCGFGGPIDEWIRGPLKEKLMDYCQEDSIRSQNIFNYPVLMRVIDSYMQYGDKGYGTGENYSRVIWSFFVFQQWYERYIHNFSLRS